jgi:hypothetical protein
VPQRWPSLWLSAARRRPEWWCLRFRL